MKTKNDGDSRRDRRLSWPFSRILCVLLGALLVALLQAVWEFPYKRPASQDLSRRFLEGPWGRLELTPFLLEKPSEMLPDASAPLPPTRWHFAGRTRDQTIAFLQSCSLTVTQLTALTASTVLVAGVQDCWVTPAPEVVLSLTQLSRERIYAELEKSPQNVAQRHPFRIRAAHAGMWFARVGLPDDKIQLIRKLVYQRGETLCFSNPEVARAYLAPHEYSALLRALYSSDTIFIRLWVQTNDPIDQIAAYWGMGGREESLKPLLKSAARNPGGTGIDLDCLLPPLPRTWLYTYPSRPKDAPSAGDCYWTSLNFFRTAAEDSFLDPGSRVNEIRKNYRVVDRAERLGDVIIFVDAQGLTQHACVYIAGDIVFTKNGAQNTHPWVLMRLDQMRSLYSEPGGQTVVFRPQRT